MLRNIIFILTVSFSFFVSQISLASVIINGTRVIYNESDDETVLQLKNQGPKPLLVQSWIDDGDIGATPDTAKSPFTITPPVTRIDSQKGQAVRIMRTNPVPLRDRETLFWFNLLEVPAKPTQQISAGANTMQFSFRSRIKLFYRPDNLSMTTAQAYQSLSFSLKKSGGGNIIHIKNPTPYYLTIRDLVIKNKKDTPVLASIAKNQAHMVSPFGELDITLDGLKNQSATGAKIFYSLIDDFGGDIHNEWTLNNQTGQ